MLSAQLKVTVLTILSSFVLVSAPQAAPRPTLKREAQSGAERIVEGYLRGILRHKYSGEQFYWLCHDRRKLIPLVKYSVPVADFPNFLVYRSHNITVYLYHDDAYGVYQVAYVAIDFTKAFDIYKNQYINSYRYLNSQLEILLKTTHLRDGNRMMSFMAHPNLDHFPIKEIPFSKEGNNKRMAEHKRLLEKLLEVVPLARDKISTFNYYEITCLDASQD